MKYIVFLRAVNVSGKNKVSMPDLKKIAEKTEFSEVQTYLNSGNIIVESENLEKIENYKDAVFWEFDLKTYQKATWWKKTAAPEVNTKITVRTANTIRKILEKAK